MGCFYVDFDMDNVCDDIYAKRCLFFEVPLLSLSLSLPLSAQEQAAAEAPHPPQWETA